MYNHFLNKDEILDTIFRLFQEEYRRLTPSVEQLDDVLARMDPEAFLSHGVQSFMDLVGDDLMGKVWRIMTIEQYRDERARRILLEDVFQGSLTFLEAAFKKMILLGRIKPYDPALMASEYQYSVFALATEYTMRKFDQMDTSSVEKNLVQHVGFFLDTVKV